MTGAAVTNAINALSFNQAEVDLEIDNLATMPGDFNTLQFTATSSGVVIKSGALTTNLVSRNTLIVDSATSPTEGLKLWSVDSSTWIIGSTHAAGDYYWVYGSDDAAIGVATNVMFNISDGITEKQYRLSPVNRSDDLTVMRRQDVIGQETLTYSGTNVWVDFKNFPAKLLVLTNDCNLIPTNIIAGKLIRIHLVQDGVGTNAVAFDSHIRFSNTNAPALPTNGSTWSIIELRSGPWATNAALTVVGTNYMR